MNKRTRKSRRKFCWTCFSYTNGELYEVCMLPPIWNNKLRQFSPPVHRDVCEWCFIQIHGINQRFGNAHECRMYWQSYQLGRGLYRKQPYSRRQHSIHPKPRFNTRCYFCEEQLGCKDLSRRVVDEHHIIPRREFANKADANKNGNRVLVHQSCHRRFNREHDQSRYHHIPFAQRWGEKDMGRNIFKQQPATIAVA